MDSLRLAVVGCGAISSLYHLPALRECHGIDLVALVDPDLAWANKVGRRFGAKMVSADYREIIGKVDAALVATPNHTHREITCELLASGVHVLCEKPLAPTVAEATAMFATARQNGTRLMAAHCLRFNPNTEFVHRLCREMNAVGPLKRLAGEIGGPYDRAPQRTDFRRDRTQAGGGVLLDLGIHLIDLFLWFTGETPTVVQYEETHEDGWDVETDAILHLQFPSKATAAITASYRRFLGKGVTIKAADGWARFAPYQPDRLDVFARHSRICRSDGVQTLLFDGMSPYARQLQHFRDAVLTELEFVVSEHEVLAGLAAIEAAYARVRNTGDPWQEVKKPQSA